MIPYRLICGSTHKGGDVEKGALSDDFAPKSRLRLELYRVSGFHRAVLWGPSSGSGLS